MLSTLSSSEKYNVAGIDYQEVVDFEFLGISLYLALVIKIVLLKILQEKIFG